MPWARAIHYLETKPNYVLFTMLKTKERSKKYKLACAEQRSSPLGLVALKADNIKIGKPSDLAKYQIGTVRNGISEKFLKENYSAFIDTYVNTSVELTLKMLLSKRVQLLLLSVEGLPSMLKNYGFEPSDFEITYQFNKTNGCFAFSSGVDDSIVNEFRNTMREVLLTEEYILLKKEYINSY